jgi:hypothetical protein
MAAGVDPIVGPLVCSCMGEVVGEELQLRPPFVVFDGWHRGAAWVLHGRAERVYSIAGRLIVTRYPAPLLGQAQVT